MTFSADPGLEGRRVQPETGRRFGAREDSGSVEAPCRTVNEAEQSASGNRSETYHTSRGGNSNGLHVTQGSAPESGRHVAIPGLDRMERRNGCVAQMDMPRNKAAVPGDGASTSPDEFTSQVSCGSTGAPVNALRSAGFLHGTQEPRVYKTFADNYDDLYLWSEASFRDDLDGPRGVMCGVAICGLVLLGLALKFHWFSI